MRLDCSFFSSSLAINKHVSVLNMVFVTTYVARACCEGIIGFLNLTGPRNVASEEWGAIAEPC